ncbi:hypothetical protein PR048_031068 [Dryococelus australis]|uniref:Uncharacterized protein n=1 Tax=Dryococelus australis TaxID=614101 RepID=A0ABQ9G8B9_9NEOP|nr:hypothetical protein PR048_031068 [Dryococelus australis]
MVLCSDMTHLTIVPRRTLRRVKRARGEERERERRAKVRGGRYKKAAPPQLWRQMPSDAISSVCLRQLHGSRWLVSASTKETPQEVPLFELQMTRRVLLLRYVRTPVLSSLPSQVCVLSKYDFFLMSHSCQQANHGRCRLITNGDRGENGAAPERKGGKNGRSPIKPEERVVSSGTFPTCENPGVIRPGIEPGSSWWEASSLTAPPPRPPAAGERTAVSIETGYKRETDCSKLRAIPPHYNMIIADVAAGESVLTALYRKRNLSGRDLGGGVGGPSSLGKCVSGTDTAHVTPLASYLVHMWESCWTMRLVGGFSPGSPVPPALAFRRCSILTSLHPHCPSRTPPKPHPLEKEPAVSWDVYSKTTDTRPANSEPFVVRTIQSENGPPLAWPSGATRRGVDPTSGRNICGEIVPDDAVGRRVFWGSPFYPPHSFRRCSISTSITLIGSQDLAVMSRPNLFTSLYLWREVDPCLPPQFSPCPASRNVLESSKRPLAQKASLVGFTPSRPFKPRTPHSPSSRNLQSSSSLYFARAHSPGGLHQRLPAAGLRQWRLRPPPRIFPNSRDASRQPVSPEHSCVVAKRIGNSSRREEVCDASKSRCCRHSRDSQKGTDSHERIVRGKREGVVGLRLRRGAAESAPAAARNNIITRGGSPGIELHFSPPCQGNSAAKL